MKRNFFRLFLSSAIIFLVSLSAFPSSEVLAKTKKETQYEVFKNLKMNSSISSAGKVIYGKSYKKKICDRPEDDARVNVLCDEEMFDSNVFYKNGKLRYLKYDFDLYPDKPFPSDSRFRMQLTFKSKDKSKELKLVEKYWYDSSVYNTQKVYNNKRIKIGMTKKQLDSIMTGKGIGQYEGQTYTDYSKVGYQEGKKDPIFYSPYKTYSYTTMNQDLTVLYSFDMEYDYKKKEYVVTYWNRFG